LFVCACHLPLGYPLTHIDHYKKELEAFYRCSFPGSEHMGRLIPVAKCQVENELRHSLSNKKLAIVFDGASVDGDLVAVLFRYVDDWTLKQVLVRTKHADCTVNNKQYVDFPS
jgi:hypothetical protein